MNKTVNGQFSDIVQARNTRDDLVASGIPSDNIYVDRDSQTLKVIIPAEEAREIEEIFTRHKLRF